MDKTPTLAQTAQLIAQLHAGQTTADGQPYYLHPLRVREIFIGWHPKATEDEQHAALLHDVVEDTSYGLDDLAGLGYSGRTVFLVKMLSRKRKVRDGKFDDTNFDGLSYAQWIDVLAGSNDRALILLKMADLHHNSEPARVKTLPKEKQSIVDKRYKPAFLKLSKAIAALDAS